MRKSEKHPKATNFIAEQPQTVYPSLAAASSGLGIDARLLKRAKRAGAPGFEANSRVRPLEVLAWLVKQLSASKDSKLALGKNESLETRLLELKVEREQFAAQADQKEFVKASDVQRWSQEMVAEFIKVLDAIPSTLAPDVAGLGIADAELRIRAAHDQAKATLREWAAKE